MAAVAMLATVSAQESGQKTFTSMPDASKALYDAVKSGDKSAMEAVLGASSAPILSSGDPVQDQKNADFFTQHYEQMNRWGKETNGDETLFMGAENWPFPVPLKKNAAGQWYFDSKAGVEEVLYRRIGNNELAAIRVCEALADAQDEYFASSCTMATRCISMRRSSSATKASRMGCTGRQPRASRKVPSVRSSSMPRGRLHQERRPVSRILLPHHHCPGRRGSGRSQELHRERQDDGRIRVRRVSGGVPQFGRDDVRRQPERRGVRERPWTRRRLIW